MINIRLSERFKFALGDFFIGHKHVIADFHEPPAVAVWMAMLAKRRVVRRIKQIEHFAVRSARIAHWRRRL